MHSTRSNRFSTFTSLRLKTAFSPVRASRSTSTTSCASTTSTRSSASIRELLAVRRRPSSLEFELRDEANIFGAEMDVLEPRPTVEREMGVMGIFEVLDGKC
jgi:hypothetical protein